MAINYELLGRCVEEFRRLDLNAAPNAFLQNRLLSLCGSFRQGGLTELPENRHSSSSAEAQSAFISTLEGINRFDVPGAYNQALRALIEVNGYRRNRSLEMRLLELTENIYRHSLATPSGEHDLLNFYTWEALGQTHPNSQTGEKLKKLAETGLERYAASNRFLMAFIAACSADPIWQRFGEAHMQAAFLDLLKEDPLSAWNSAAEVIRTNDRRIFSRISDRSWKDYGRAWKECVRALKNRVRGDPDDLRPSRSLVRSLYAMRTDAAQRIAARDATPS